MKITNDDKGNVKLTFSSIEFSNFKDLICEASDHFTGLKAFYYDLSSAKIKE